ncbi:MAG: hypothetical protein M0Z29_07710 [Actinomycetota bacterium]|nr:hypothetical protein [Actinomycetota bacterium]
MGRSSPTTSGLELLEDEPDEEPDDPDEEDDELLPQAAATIENDAATVASFAHFFKPFTGTPLQILLLLLAIAAPANPPD